MMRYAQRAILTEYIYQGEEVDVDFLAPKTVFEVRKTVWAGMFNTVLSHFWSVRAGNIIETTDCIQPREKKRVEEEEQERIYREKKMDGQFVRDHGDDVEKQKSWEWVTKADLKATTEALIFVAQEQAIRTNYVRFLTDKTISSPLCRMSGQRGETLLHLIRECNKLAQGEYKGRHYNVGRKVHWELHRKYNLGHAKKWYEYQPQGVLVIVSYCGISIFNVTME